MGPSSPEIRRRQALIRRSLCENGFTISETAELAGISESRVYAFARRHSLPLNQPVTPGGTRERRALQVLALGGDIPALCEALRICPKIASQLHARLSKGSSPPR